MNEQASLKTARPGMMVGIMSWADRSAGVLDSIGRELGRMKMSAGNLKSEVSELGRLLEAAKAAAGRLYAAAASEQVEQETAFLSSEQGRTAAMKQWDSKFMSARDAKILGANYPEISYVPFHELSHRDQELARRMYPYKGVGSKYPFVDEHYYYPFHQGELYKGGRRMNRVLAIPYKLIQDGDYMMSLGYEVSPAWRGGSVAGEILKVAKGVLAGGWRHYSEELCDILEALPLVHRGKDNRYIIHEVHKDKQLIQMMRDEGMTDRELNELLDDSREMYLIATGRVAEDEGWLTAAQVEMVCPACANKMREAGIARVRESSLKVGAMTWEECIADAKKKKDVRDPEALCGWLKKYGPNA